MGKDGVLGHDPLGWMKVGSESKKAVSLGDDGPAEQNAARSDQPSGSQITTKQQIPSPASDERTQHIPKQSHPPEKTGTRSDIASVPKQKVVIGRLYEKPSAEKTKSMPRNEHGLSQASRPYAEPPTPAPPRVQPIQGSEHSIDRTPVFLSAERTSTYIIIAYTALLLVLGYLVYNDLSKRTSRIEARLFTIEKALRLKQR